LFYCRPADEVLQELGEYVLPHFPAITGLENNDSIEKGLL